MVSAPADDTILCVAGHSAGWRTRVFIFQKVAALAGHGFCGVVHGAQCVPDLAILQGVFVAGTGQQALFCLLHRKNQADAQRLALFRRRPWQPADTPRCVLSKTCTTIISRILLPNISPARHGTPVGSFPVRPSKEFSPGLVLEPVTRPETGPLAQGERLVYAGAHGYRPV